MKVEDKLDLDKKKKDLGKLKNMIHNLNKDLDNPKLEGIRGN
jgi:hypothetical protein